MHSHALGHTDAHTTHTCASTCTQMHRCTHLCEHTHALGHTDVHTPVQVHALGHTDTPLCKYIPTCTRAHRRTRTHNLREHMYSHRCTHAHTCANTYMHVLGHTHSYAQAHASVRLHAWPLLHPGPCNQSPGPAPDTRHRTPPGRTRPEVASEGSALWASPTLSFGSLPLMSWWEYVGHLAGWCPVGGTPPSQTSKGQGAGVAGAPAGLVLGLSLGAAVSGLRA